MRGFPMPLDTATSPCYNVSMEHEANKVIVLEGMAWMRTFCACQALMAPTKFYRVTHKRAREVLREELGFCPKGKPGTAEPATSLKPGGSGFRSGGQDAILDWLQVVHMEQHGEPNCVTADDRTLLVVKS